MRKRKIFSGTGGLLLLLILLMMHFAGLGPDVSFSGTLKPLEAVFVEAAGDVKNPGVYGFSHPPQLTQLVKRAGGFSNAGIAPEQSAHEPFVSGSRVYIASALYEKVVVRQSRMSPFYRVTLDIPISINIDTALGLTAVPGIGPKTASAIVKFRERYGGFKQLKDLMSIRGISDAVYAKIRPYLTL